MSVLTSEAVCSLVVTLYTTVERLDDMVASSLRNHQHCNIHEVELKLLGLLL